MFWKLKCDYYFVGSELLITGPSDLGVPCPSPSYEYTYSGIVYCCCGGGCCWDKCASSAPPTNCLQGVSGGEWIYSAELGYFQAFATTIGGELTAACY